jgi:hypothetical protein
MSLRLMDFRSLYLLRATGALTFLNSSFVGMKKSMCSVYSIKETCYLDEGGSH